MDPLLRKPLGPFDLSVLATPSLPGHEVAFYRRWRDFGLRRAVSARLSSLRSGFDRLALNSLHDHDPGTILTSDFFWLI